MKINSGTILIGFFAVLCGLVGVHLYREANRRKPVVVQKTEPAPARAPAKTIVPMVSRNLVPGQKITMDDVALVRMSAEERKATGLKKAYMTNPDQIIGKTVKVPLRRGDTFDTRDFYPLGTGPGIAHRLKPGFRAMTISLSPANALIGFAGPGQKVDVLFHYGQNTNAQNIRRAPTGTVPNRNYSHNRNAYTANNSKLVAATATLAQGVEILALNHGTTEETTPNGVGGDIVMVTLAVKPRDAEKLRVARGHGELSLTLRSPTDRSMAIMPMPSTVDDLIRVQPPSVSQMEIFRGTSVSRMNFVNHSGGVIKPQQVSLPQLKIHVPAGLQKDGQFPFNMEETEEALENEKDFKVKGEEPFLESADASGSQQRLFVDGAKNEFQPGQTVQPGDTVAPTGQALTEIQTSRTFLPHANQQPPMLAPVATSQPDMNPLPQSKSASGPSLEGVRFSTQYQNGPQNQQSAQGMPNSIMSSGRQDYRATHLGTYGLERK